MCSYETERSIASEQRAVKVTNLWSSESSYIYWGDDSHSSLRSWHTCSVFTRPGAEQEGRKWLHPVSSPPFNSPLPKRVADSTPVLSPHPVDPLQLGWGEGEGCNV